MKTLTILGLVQTALLLFLLGKIVLVDEETSVAARAEQNTLVSDPFDDASIDSHAAAMYYSDEDQPRKIIREELAAQLGALSESGAQKQSAAVLELEDETAFQYQRELVAQQLEYHTSVGSISDMDMQKLQGQIAKLDKASRTQMLRKLTRALNSGRLEGRL